LTYKLFSREIVSTFKYVWYYRKVRTSKMMSRLAFCVLCDKKVPIKLKYKFYRVVVKSTLLYEAQYWCQEFSCSEDTSSRDEDVEIDLWTYWKR